MKLPTKRIFALGIATAALASSFAAPGPKLKNAFFAGFNKLIEKPLRLNQLKKDTIVDFENHFSPEDVKRLKTDTKLQQVFCAALDVECLGLVNENDKQKDYKNKDGISPSDAGFRLARETVMSLGKGNFKAPLGPFKDKDGHPAPDLGDAINVFPTVQQGYSFYKGQFDSSEVKNILKLFKQHIRQTLKPGAAPGAKTL